MMSDQELRIFALQLAERLEGPKAVTEEVLERAKWIYEFLTDAESAVGREMPN